jgi:hypothetical protein
MDQDGTAVIMAVYVDDLIIAGRNRALVKQVINDLKGHFQVKELGPIKWVLGISVDRNLEAGTTIIHQKKYINDMVTRFGQQDAAPIGLPYAGGDEKTARGSDRLRLQGHQPLPLNCGQPIICSSCHSPRHN